jgi:hypothetical protein
MFNIVFRIDLESATLMTLNTNSMPDTKINKIFQ